MGLNYRITLGTGFKKLLLVQYPAEIKLGHENDLQNIIFVVR